MDIARRKIKMMRRNRENSHVRIEGPAGVVHAPSEEIIKTKQGRRQIEALKDMPGKPPFGKIPNCS